MVNLHLYPILFIVHSCSLGYIRNGLNIKKKKSNENIHDINCLENNVRKFRILAI